MIAIRRDLERHRDRRPRLRLWHSFSSHDPGDPLGDGFGALEILDEDRLSPDADRPRPRHADRLEVVTYVRAGAVAYEDSWGGSGVIHAGEFQRTTSRRGARHRETNASRIHPAHVFQLGLRSPAQLEPGSEQRRFSAAQRRGGFCLIASPDGRSGSLRVHPDARMYAALLDTG